MPTRMALLVLDFTIFLAMSLATAQASRAADDCLSKPNAAARTQAREGVLATPPFREQTRHSHFVPGADITAMH